MTRSFRALVPALAALAAVPLVGLPAAAADTMTVDLVACASQGGTVTVPAGTDAVVRLPDAVGGRKQLADFLSSQVTTLHFGAEVGVADLGVTDTWSASVRAGRGLWRSRPADYQLSLAVWGGQVTLSTTVQAGTVAPHDGRRAVVVAQGQADTCTFTSG